MDDLVAFIRERLDADEQMARDAGGRNWVREAYGCVVDANDNGLIVYGEGTPTREQADHIALHDPARVLLEVEAKRRLLYQFEHRGNSVRATVAPSTGGVWDDLLRILALPYSDHPSYREEWRP